VTLRKARQSWARNFATSFNIADLSEDELAEMVGEIQLLDNSLGVRARLLMMRAGLGPIFAGRQRVQGWLRQRVKALLYPATETRRG
jgi:hypothetical protein